MIYKWLATNIKTRFKSSFQKSQQSDTPQQGECIVLRWMDVHEFNFLPKIKNLYNYTDLRKKETFFSNYGRLKFGWCIFIMLIACRRTKCFMCSHWGGRREGNINFRVIFTLVIWRRQANDWKAFIRRVWHRWTILSCLTTSLGSF